MQLNNYNFIGGSMQTKCRVSSGFSTLLTLNNLKFILKTRSGKEAPLLGKMIL